MKILVTGGAGFIGSSVVRQLMRESDATVINLDKLTYAGNLDSVAEVVHHPRYFFEKADICDAAALRHLLLRHQPDAIMHLAAESHVDRSIDGPAQFIETNIVGTYTLLEAVREYWQGLVGEARNRFRFHHISTDEVFGSLGSQGSFNEEMPYRPNSPYAASKAASDHLARVWHHTYGLPVVVTNCSNNYGPYQFPEKLIPLMIIKAMRGEPLPVYGKGENVRDWLYVDDHARALILVLEKGRVGETYNIGGRSERTNLEVVRSVCALLDELAPDLISATPRMQLVHFVSDRPGHDLRYAIDTGKIERELHWRPQENFESGMRKTVLWYLHNPWWWQRVLDGRYRGERLGLSMANSEST